MIIKIFYSTLLFIFTSGAMANETNQNGVNKIGRFETSIQVDDKNPMNRFVVHRVVQVNTEGQPMAVAKLKGAVILLPGSQTNFRMYDLTADDHSFAAILAARGYDVFGYSPRATFLPDGFCEAAPGNCDFVAQWGFDSTLSDIEIVRSKIRQLGHDRPVIGGHSLGAFHTVAAVNQAPLNYRGAVLIDGMLYSKNLEVTGPHRAVCEMLSAPNAPVVDNTQTYIIKQLTGLMLQAPDDPSPIIQGLSNRAAFFAAITMPSPEMNPVPGMILAAGPQDLSGFTFASESTVVRFIEHMNFYEPNGNFRDGFCAIAGDRKYTSNLDQFKGPIFVLGAEHGMGPYMKDTVDLFASSSHKVEVTVSGFGHADFFGTEAESAKWANQLADWMDAN